MKRILILTFCLFCMADPSSLFGATAKVVKAGPTSIQIDIGSDRGVSEGMVADVYKEAGRIIHPVTGEDYGVRRVKIARIEIINVNNKTADGRYLLQYAPVQPGDVVDGIAANPTREEQLQNEINEARSEIKALARSLADEIKNNQKSIEDLRQTLRRIGSSEKRLNSVLNAVRNMRERMVIIENKMEFLEEQQNEMVMQDSSEVNLLSSLDINELGVLQRGAGDEVYLQVGNKMYRLDFEGNQVAEVTTGDVAQSPAAMEGEMTGSPVSEEDLLFEEDPMEEATPWYMNWQIAAGVLFLGLVGAAAVLFLKKRKQSGDDDSNDDDDEMDMEIEEDSFPEAEEEILADDLPDLEPAEADTEE